MNVNVNRHKSAVLKGNAETDTLASYHPYRSVVVFALFPRRHVLFSRSQAVNMYTLMSLFPYVGLMVAGFTGSSRDEAGEKTI